MCGVAAIIHHSGVECIGLSGKYWETRNSCPLLMENRMGVTT
jgi:hypothetical protein